jgi:hypothetical protein
MPDVFVRFLLLTKCVTTLVSFVKTQVSVYFFCNFLACGWHRDRVKRGLSEVEKRRRVRFGFMQPPRLSSECLFFLSPVFKMTVFFSDIEKEFE